MKKLKELKKREYLCPQDIKFTNSHFAGTALSGILLKPFYTDISITDKFANWDDAALRWAVLPKEQVHNPCIND